MKVTSSTGQEYEIPEGLKTDFRFLRAFKRARSGTDEEKFEATVDVVDIVLGSEENVQRFLRDIADESGRVPADRVFAELRSMLDQAAATDAETKNS